MRASHFPFNMELEFTHLLPTPLTPHSTITYPFINISSYLFPYHPLLPSAFKQQHPPPPSIEVEVYMPVLPTSYRVDLLYGKLP